MRPRLFTSPDGRFVCVSRRTVVLHHESAHTVRGWIGAGPVNWALLSPCGDPPAWLRTAAALFADPPRRARRLVRGHVYAYGRRRSGLFVCLGAGQLLRRDAAAPVDVPALFVEVGALRANEVRLHLGLLADPPSADLEVVTEGLHAFALGRLLPEDWFAEPRVLIAHGDLVNLGPPMVPEQLLAARALMDLGSG